MKKIIDLSNTVFDFTKLSADDFPKTAIWTKKKELVTVTDFGTIFQGLELVTDPLALAELEDAAVGKGPVFSIPDSWGWPQIAKAVGAFPSSTRARKNGWSGFPDPGFNFKKVRINKVVGEILVVKVTNESPLVTEF